MLNDNDTLPFAREEYAERLKRTRMVMQERQLDALVITEPANMFYLTGYDAWSFYVPQAVIVDLTEDLPVWFGREQDGNCARATTFLPESQLFLYSDDHVQAADRHPMQLLGTWLKDRGYASRHIGVEMGAFYYTARAHAELVRALPDARFQDAELLVNWVRAVKSPAEIRYLKEAGEIAERMMSRAVSVAAPGVRECDLVAEIYHAQMKGTEAFGGVYSTSQPHIGAGRRANSPHLTWRDTPLGNDAPINMEFAGCRFRYHGPIGRTIYLGRPPQRYLDLAAAVIEGLESALATVRPGVTCEDVEAAWRATVSRWGFTKNSRAGYSIGIGYPPTWGERTMSLRPGDRTALQANMAFHLMPAIWVGDTGVTITQSFHVTESGYEPLTRLPRELIVKN